VSTSNQDGEEALESLPAVVWMLNALQKPMW
jgi:hypothetical protein